MESVVVRGYMEGAGVTGWRFHRERRVVRRLFFFSAERRGRWRGVV